ncbi:hypothetical protein K438DRAFT_2020058 [Mycena galopus ATCC 62051]|nr:hypothetical protein K438DRAFT_2020058 [Mycena galopus ATCC 62051]
MHLSTELGAQKPTDLLDRFPPELWREILEDLTTDFLYPSLKNFSMACRHFSHLSRSHLFSDITFSIYRIDSDGALLLPSPTEVDRRLERLNFLSSPGIVPLVRGFCISPWDSWVDTTPSAWTFSTDNAHILLDAVFQRLRRFTGLQWLRVSQVVFTKVMVDTVCHLPMLSALSVFRCTAAPGERIETSSRVLRVTKFSLVPNRKLGHESDHWIHNLHPDYLRIFDVADFSCLARMVHRLPSFPNVDKLTVTHNAPVLSQNLLIMSKFPAVRILELNGKGNYVDAPGVQTSAIFPLLEQYSGPHDALPLFLPATTLTSLYIQRCRAEDLIIRIQGFKGSNLTIFRAEFDTFDNKAFDKLVELFPKLTEILIRIEVSEASSMFERVVHDRRELEDEVVVEGGAGGGIRTGFKPSTLLHKLADAPFLPPGLERFGISWDFPQDEFYDHLSAYKLPGFARLRDTFVARCSQLTLLLLNGFFFMFEWRDPMPEGIVKKFTAENLNFTQLQNQTMFWDWERYD